MIGRIAAGIYLIGCQFCSADPIVVFAASSLKAPLDAITEQYEAATGQQVRVSYAASSVLARQIGFGAPADVFVSANDTWMTYLIEQGVLDHAKITNIAGNSLVIAAKHPAVPLDLSAAAMLYRLDGARLGVPLIDAVPLGQYAKAAFDELGLLDALQPTFAQQDSARGTVVSLLRGEVPLAVLYASDVAQNADIVSVATVATDLHPPVVYQVGLLGSDAAETAYLNALTSDAAQDVFRDFGFTIP